MKRYLLLYVVLGILAACTNNNKIPEGIIVKPKMEKIMWEMVQADRFVNGFIIKPNDSIDSKQEIARVYAQVFKVNGITQEDFLKSYKFYLSRPDITKVMFDSITAKAERRKSELYQPKKKDTIPRALDSLLRKRGPLLQKRK